jgi:hypothetical protein
MIDAVCTRWGGHHLFLGPVDQASTGVVAWAEHGLDRAGKLLYAGSAFTGIEELVAALAGAGVDAAPAAAAGQLVVVDPDRFHSPTLLLRPGLGRR